MSNEIEEIFSTETANGKQQGSLGIDRKGKLYWNGKEVITKQEVRLQWWVNMALIVGAISTLVLAVIAVLQFVCGGK